MTNDAQRLIQDTRAELEAQARNVTEGKGREPSARECPPQLVRNQALYVTCGFHPI